jgi:hypothetical protein
MIIISAPPLGFDTSSIGETRAAGSDRGHRVSRQPCEGSGADFGAGVLSFAQNRVGGDPFHNLRKVQSEFLGVLRADVWLNAGSVSKCRISHSFRDELKRAHLHFLKYDVNMSTTKKAGCIHCMEEVIDGS